MSKQSNKLIIVCQDPEATRERSKHLQRRKSRRFGIEVGPRGIRNIKARRRNVSYFVAIARAQ